jgi:hypothetical protein
MTNFAVGVAADFFVIAPKKVPPPTPDGREGRLFPPEQFLKLWC